MIFENLTKLLLSGASICFGAVLGILRSKIFASKNSNSLYYIFYGFAILIFVLSLATGIFFSDKIFVKGGLFGIIVLLFSILSSIGLFIFSNKFLVFKNVYKTTKLDPIVNSFTSKADKNEIKLFGGDLNFFGNEPSQINNNSQYTHLRSIGFKKICILCETPDTSTKQIRYGKLLHELEGVELRFYDPEKADLNVRGRIIRLNGVNKLLIYSRISSGVYQAIETDLANSNGALYNNIWELAWSMAKTPKPDEIVLWIALYKRN